MDPGTDFSPNAIEGPSVLLSSRSLSTRMRSGLYARWTATREWLSDPLAVWSALRYRFTRNALPFTKQILKPLADAPPPGATRLVLFAHYDPQDQVDDYVCFYLQQLHACGCAVVFVSGAAGLRAESAAKILPFCEGVFTQQTRSLDFGSWNLAWQYLQHRGWRLDHFQQFILANDSVYGPLFPLQEMLGSFTGADMYGMTESNEGGNHLQSFFLVWDLNANTRAFLKLFWQRFRYVVGKQKLIRTYEIGISRMARRAGLRLQAYAPDEKVRAAFAQRYAGHQHASRVAEGSVNNTLLLWDILIEEFRCPFLKTDLPRNNRYHSEKIPHLSGELRRWTTYDPGLIERNLQRLGIRPSVDSR